MIVMKGGLYVDGMYQEILDCFGGDFPVGGNFNSHIFGNPDFRWIVI